MHGASLLEGRSMWGKVGGSAKGVLAKELTWNNRQEGPSEEVAC